MKLQDIVIAHAKYKVSLRNFVENGSEQHFPEHDLLLWLDEQERHLHHLPSYRILRREHEAFQNYVSAVLTVLSEGKRAQARALIYSEMFVLISDGLVDSASRLERDLRRKDH